MDKIKSYGLHVLSYVMSALAFYAGLDPTVLAAVGGPKALAAAGLAGAIVTGVHNVMVAGTPKPGEVVVKAHWLATLVVAAVATVMLVGCATPQTAKEQSAIVVSVNLAAGFAIQQDDRDPAVWKARATKYKDIALKLQTVNDAGTATVATLAAELQPLVAKLDPAEQNAARAFIAAVTPYLQDQANSNAQVANTRERVATLLDAVIAACSDYGA